MTIDMTTPCDTLISLGEYLKIYPEDILIYIAKNKDLTVDDFIEHFNIDMNELLNKELYLCCLHVTTNSDKCKSIEKYGLTNLQDSIKLNTPLAKYLKENGIYVDIQNKIISYKGKIVNISLENDKYKVYYKFFKDYQINAFFSYNNVLNYGGGIKDRPEILYNLSRVLANRNIEFDWSKQKNKCYVIKYKAKISDFTYDTFGLSKNYYLSDSIYNEKYKIKWIINSCIRIIHDNNFYDNLLPEILAFMKFDVIIPYSNIIDIYTEEEYKIKFNIN